MFVVVFDQLICRYSIEWRKDSENHFDIDPVEGTLSVSEALDRERNAEHNVTVVATKVSKYGGLTRKAGLQAYYNCRLKWGLSWLSTILKTTSPSSGEKIEVQQCFTSRG